SATEPAIDRRAHRPRTRHLMPTARHGAHASASISEDASGVRTATNWTLAHASGTMPRVSPPDAPISLPYRFDTSSVWRTILKGAFGLNALLTFSILFTVLVSRELPKALGLVLMELLVLYFTRVFMRFQEGSIGTLSSDRVVIEPNVLLGVRLPGPSGTYTLDRFSAVRVEFRSGPVTPGVQA